MMFARLRTLARWSEYRFAFRPGGEVHPLTAATNEAQAERLRTSTGPSGFLLSRTGTTLGIPGAISMQLPPLSPL